MNSCKMDWECAEGLVDGRTQVAGDRKPSTGVDVSAQPGCVPDDEHEYK